MIGDRRDTVSPLLKTKNKKQCVVKHSRPPDLKSTSNVSLPFALITGPRKRTQLAASMDIDCQKEALRDSVEITKRLFLLPCFHHSHMSYFIFPWPLSFLHKSITLKSALKLSTLNIDL